MNYVYSVIIKWIKHKSIKQYKKKCCASIISLMKRKKLLGKPNTNFINVEIVKNVNYDIAFTVVLFDLNYHIVVNDVFISKIHS